MLNSKFIINIIVWCCLLSAGVIFGISLPNTELPTFNSLIAAQPSVSEEMEAEPEPEPENKGETTATTPITPVESTQEVIPPPPPPPDPTLVLPETCRKLAAVEIRADTDPNFDKSKNVKDSDIPIVKKVAVVRLYEAMRNVPLWTNKGVLTSQAETILKVLSQSDSKGLPTSVYTGVNWSDLLQTATTDTEQICRDLAFSVTIMRYITHLRIGQINPTSLEKSFNTKRDVDFSAKRLDLAEFIIKLSTATEPAVMLDSLEPTLFPYQTLVRIVQQHHKFNSDPRFKTPLATIKGAVRSGQRYRDAALLAQKLEAFGDLPSGQANVYTKPTYSQELADSVKQFQKRNGLKVDGILGAGTIRALNMPAVGKIKQVLALLERWRWMPNNLGNRPILVNIPEYKLYALEDDGNGWYKTAFEMNVVVGKNDPKYRTPMIQSAIRTLEFTPYWNVPMSILRREFYSSVRSGRIGGGYEIVGANGKKAPINKNTLAGLWQGTMRLRQRPGGGNVLGVVKFIFPNIDGVYLHDTQAKSLFSRANRAFSHGCIRLAEPIKLATHIMSVDAGWDKKKINAVIGTRKNTPVQLKTPVAVYLVYNTIMVKSDGNLRFIPDVYGYDSILIQALEEAKKDTPPI
jgi:murein L,D-transpeptidase YcbB/YkuD